MGFQNDTNPGVSLVVVGGGRGRGAHLVAFRNRTASSGAEGELQLMLILFKRLMFYLIVTDMLS